ncbi:helix-turn-helix domain-containing protein [Arcticibacter tournemirensis]|nr:helix-turn-helix domain-containing protein [Arcticibacter tournemirensis]
MPPEPSKPPEDDVWLSSKEAMMRLRISASTFYRLKKAHKLKQHRMGGRDYYRQSDIDRCYEEA